MQTNAYRQVITGKEQQLRNNLFEIKNIFNKVLKGDTDLILQITVSLQGKYKSFHK